MSLGLTVGKNVIVLSMIRVTKSMVHVDQTNVLLDMRGLDVKQV